MAQSSLPATRERANPQFPRSHYIPLIPAAAMYHAPWCHQGIIKIPRNQSNGIIPATLRHLGT